MRHGICPHRAARGGTPARLAAAARALCRERERLPLFAGQVAAEQGTPEERISRLDRDFLEYEDRQRGLAARQWRIGRRLLEGVSEQIRSVLLQQWDASSVPAEAAYFVDYVRTRLRRWGIIEGPFNRHGGRHPGLLDESALWDADELRKAWLANYFDAAGVQIASSRTTPARYPAVPLGAWKIDRSFRGIHGRFIDQLVALDPGGLLLPEGDYTKPGYNPEGRAWDAEHYAGWMREGHEPPPITVLEMESGALSVSDGHRRTAAAKMVGRTIRAWISWTVDTDRLDSQGKPIKTGLTYELAQAMLDKMLERESRGSRFRVASPSGSA